MDKFMFVGNHPHVGEMCEPKVDERMTTIGNVKMWPWNIINCSHGAEWCYATKEQTRKVRLDDDHA